MMIKSTMTTTMSHTMSITMTIEGYSGCKQFVLTYISRLDRNQVLTIPSYSSEVQHKHKNSRDMLAHWLWHTVETERVLLKITHTLHWISLYRLRENESADHESIFRCIVLWTKHCNGLLTGCFVICLVGLDWYETHLPDFPSLHKYETESLTPAHFIRTSGSKLEQCANVFIQLFAAESFLQ